MSPILITKRAGGTEPLDLNKLHKVVIEACGDLAGVSASEIEMKAKISFQNKMKTADIQETLIKAAADLISEESPNYQYVAGRLINYHLRKGIYGQFEPIRLYDHIVKTVDAGFYDPILLQAYTEQEWDKIEKFVRHDRDVNLSYAAMEQMRGKYLVKNRVTKEIMETPQMAYILIAAFLFQNYPKETRLKWVKEYYDASSEGYISLPTPIMAGVRTPQRQYSSCVLIEAADDLNSIFTTAHAIGLYVSQKAGIGIGGGSLRPVGSPVRNGDTATTGVIPYFRIWQDAVKSCSQGGVRGGAATLYYPIWHMEIEDLLVLKNNKGTDITRLRGMDYGVQFNKLMYERLINGENITLMSPKDVPGLYEAFFSDQDKFKEIYERAERNTRLRKISIPAHQLFAMFMQERKETGRIYLMNVDNVNLQGSFNPDRAPVRMSNLCLTGDSLVSLKKDDGSLLEVELKDVGFYLYDLAEGEELWIWSYDEVTGEPKWSLIDAWAKTSDSAETLKITDTATGYSVQCTPEHKLLTNRRGWVEAKDLLESDSLVLSTIPKGFRKGRCLKSKKITVPTPVFDLTVSGTHNFYANGILVHNCAEITLPTKPLYNINDEQGEIALCILSAINWGLIKHPDEFERYAKLAVRALDELIDIQSYPILAAENSTRRRRSLGVGIIGFAYWMAKNDVSYENPGPEGLALIDEWAEAWAFYLTKASVELAKEKGPCDALGDTKYGFGQTPNENRKKGIDDLVPYIERMPWEALRDDLLATGIRNSTLMALMPSETSSQIANVPNGIEPVKQLVTVKGSKDGALPQVVPEIRRLKNKYSLQFSLKSPKGYLSIMAVLQKYVDQAISVNTSYNPKFYDKEEIPMSEMLQDLLFFYKYGGKNLYYFNVPDAAGEHDVSAQHDQPTDYDSSCETCTI